MPLATLDDVNVHLPEDKIELLDAIDEDVQRDTERIVKAYLAGVYSPTTLAGWSDPDETTPSDPGYVPETIHAIAGRFIAAFVYAQRYSEDIPDIPEYAQFKYNEAMSMLRDIKSGALILNDVVAETPDTGQRFTREDFWPRDDTTPGPVFTMDSEF